MNKTPDYNLKAVQNYNSKFDRVAVNLPKGTKEKIKELTGKSCNAYISELVLADIERLENKPPQDASGAETVSEIVKSAPAAEAPQNVDLQALCAVYSKDTILSVAGQLEIFQRYGEEVMNKLVKYARAGDH